MKNHTVRQSSLQAVYLLLRESSAQGEGNQALHLHERFQIFLPFDLIACQREVRYVLQPGQWRNIRNLIIGQPQAGKARQPGQRRKVADLAVGELRNRQLLHAG